VDGRQDEAAQLGSVDDVDEHRTFLCVPEDPVVDRAHRRGRDDQRVPGEVVGLIALPAPVHRQLLQLLLDLRRYDGDDCAAFEQPLRLLEADLATADHQTAPSGQVEAREVVALLVRVAHALTLATRAPWRSRRSDTSSSPALTESVNAP